jgi:hypothetical protein
MKPLKHRRHFAERIAIVKNRLADYFNFVTEVGAPVAVEAPAADRPTAFPRWARALLRC